MKDLLLLLAHLLSTIAKLEDPGQNKVSGNEGADAPRQQGARRENTRGIRPTSNAAGVDAAVPEWIVYFDRGP